MSNAEEVAQELEALEAIFGEDYKATPEGCSVFATPQQGGEQDDGAQHVSCWLHFAFGPSYPLDGPPEGISAVSVKGLGESRCKELSTKLMSEAEKLIGSPAVFMLVEAAREWLAERNVPGVSDDSSMHASMMARQQEKKIEATQATVVVEAAASLAAARMEKLKGVKHTGGTPVTPASFAAWLAAYKKETGADKNDGKKILSGRQIFEVGNIDLDDAADGLQTLELTPSAAPAGEEDEEDEDDEDYDSQEDDEDFDSEDEEEEEEEEE